MAFWAIVYTSFPEGVTSPNNTSASEFPDSCPIQRERKKKLEKEKRYGANDHYVPGRPAIMIAVILGLLAQGISTGPTTCNTTTVLGFTEATACICSQKKNR